MPKCELLADLETHPVQDIYCIQYLFPQCESDADRSLVVTMNTQIDTEKLDVVFDYPISVRILDEMHLTEFWNDFSLPNGWLWRVESGGYLNLERTRPQFLAEFYSNGPALREYLLVADQCVSVISFDDPEIHGKKVSG